MYKYYTLIMRVKLVLADMYMWFFNQSVIDSANKEFFCFLNLCIAITMIDGQSHKNRLAT